MIKILLLSQDNEHVGKVRNVCDDYDFVLETCPIFEPLDIDIENYRLIIADVCNLEIEDNDYYRDVFSKINTAGSPRLLIISHSPGVHALKVQDIPFKYDDIIFSDRIEEELYTRIAFLMSFAVSAQLENCIVIGNLVLNLDKYELSINGVQIELTFKEYELLKLFLENPDKVFSRNKLLSIVWGYDFYGGSRTVDVHMRRLRSKLAVPYIDMLKTVRNVGYMFTPEISRDDS